MLHSSLMRLQKIDMMHALLPLHRKRLHCILDCKLDQLTIDSATFL